MKAIISFIAVVTALLFAGVSSPVSAQDMPGFNVQVAPCGNCSSGNAGNAYVRITYKLGGEWQSQDGFTNGAGWIYLSAPAGDVDVNATHNGHYFSGLRTQTTSGSTHYICTSDNIEGP
jgi:hypothetical protein